MKASAPPKKAALISPYTTWNGLNESCSYEGYVTGAGAEGVGRSTARAVVISSVAILILDGLVAAALAQYIGA